MIAAMNSAIAIYYGKHGGTFPAHPGRYAIPSPPEFQCDAAGFSYAYDATTGLITTSKDVNQC